MSTLLEREPELAELDALVVAACAGAGRLGAIEAAAGIGKTRLLQAARERGRGAGMRVLAARATELERDFPFALVRQLFEPALAALDEAAREALLEGAAGAARGALGIAADARPAPRRVRRAARPLLADRDAGRAAAAAARSRRRALVRRRLARLPRFLCRGWRSCRCCSCSPAAPTRPAPRSSLARIATDAQARRLTPRALSPGAAAALLAAELERQPEAAFAATCHEVSGGNPFLLCELARTLAAEEVRPAAEQAPRVRELAPERVTRTVLVRLARLSPEAQAVAHAVVVLGDDADSQLAAALAEVDDGSRRAPPTSCERPRSSTRTRRSASSTRSCARRSTPSSRPASAPTRTRARPSCCATHGASAQQLAAHLVATEARSERVTAETLLEAGRQALANGAPRSAIAYLTRALREPPPDDLRPAILSRLIMAGIRAPDQELFAATLPEVLEELERDEGLRVRWAIKVATWMIFNGRAADALALLERGIEIATERGDAEGAFRLEAQRSLLVRQSLTEQRARLAPYVDRIAPDSGSGRLAAAFAAEWHAFDGTAAEATEAARLALGREGRIFAEQPEFFAPGRPVLALMVADELDTAERIVARARTIARERGATPELVASWWMSSGVAWARGDLVAAEADVRQALSVARLGGLRLAELPLRAMLASVLVARGELDAADAEIAASSVGEEIPDVIWLTFTLFARGVLRLAQGRFEQAAADLLELERRATRWGVFGIAAPPAEICAARAVAALGDRERARAKAEAAVAHARHWGGPGLLSHALRTLALTVDGADRLAALEEAAAVVDGSPARLVRAEALTDLGAELRRTGRRVDARPPLREALDMARRCGATGLARRAFDELTATGEKVRTYTPIGVESLTPSQRRVAELAASGLTNRQIAQTLFLTVKTIEAHLAAAYDKLGIRSRQELPGALGELAPGGDVSSAAAGATRPGPT